MKNRKARSLSLNQSLPTFLKPWGTKFKKKRGSKPYSTSAFKRSLLKIKPFALELYKTFNEVKPVKIVLPIEYIGSHYTLYSRIAILSGCFYMFRRTMDGPRLGLLGSIESVHFFIKTHNLIKDYLDNYFPVLNRRIRLKTRRQRYSRRKGLNIHVGNAKTLFSEEKLKTIDSIAGGVIKILGEIQKKDPEAYYKSASYRFQLNINLKNRHKRWRTKL